MPTGRVAAFCFLTVALTGPLFGQGTTLGSIVGTVFDASGSSDNVGIASYRWDFGDNSTVSTQAAVTHVYSRPGTYSASLTVTDAEGNLQTARFTVTVRPVSPKNGELLDMIHTLDWILAALAVALAFVGFLAITMWRRKEKPPEMVMHPGQQTQLPPPPSS